MQQSMQPSINSQQRAYNPHPQFALNHNNNNSNGNLNSNSNNSINSINSNNMTNIINNKILTLPIKVAPIDKIFHIAKFQNTAESDLGATLQNPTLNRPMIDHAKKWRPRVGKKNKGRSSNNSIQIDKDENDDDDNLFHNSEKFSQALWKITDKDKKSGFVGTKETEPKSGSQTALLQLSGGVFYLVPSDSINFRAEETYKTHTLEVAESIMSSRDKSNDRWFKRSSVFQKYEEERVSAIGGMVSSDAGTAAIDKNYHFLGKDDDDDDEKMAKVKIKQVANNEQEINEEEEDDSKSKRNKRERAVDFSDQLKSDDEDVEARAELEQEAAEEENQPKKQEEGEEEEDLDQDSEALKRSEDLLKRAEQGGLTQPKILNKKEKLKRIQEAEEDDDDDNVEVDDEDFDLEDDDLEDNNNNNNINSFNNLNTSLNEANNQINRKRTMSSMEGSTIMAPNNNLMDPSKRSRVQSPLTEAGLVEVYFAMKRLAGNAPIDVTDFVKKLHSSFLLDKSLLHSLLNDVGVFEKVNDKRYISLKPEIISKYFR